MSNHERDEKIISKLLEAVKELLPVAKTFLHMSITVVEAKKDSDDLALNAIIQLHNCQVTIDYLNSIDALIAETERNIE